MFALGQKRTFYSVQCPPLPARPLTYGAMLAICPTAPAPIFSPRPCQVAFLNIGCSRVVDPHVIYPFGDFLQFVSGNANSGQPI
jgi:hypothetical protein